MSAFGRLSIRRRLVVLILLASSFAFGCVAAAVVLYEATSFRPRAMLDLRREGAILVEVLRPSLDFSDQASALRFLDTFRRAKPEIAQASAYDASGRVFATSVRSGAVSVPAVAGAPGVRLDGNELSLWLPIERNKQVLGFLHLREELPPLYSRLPQYGIMAGAVVLTLIVVGVVLFGGARRYVITPMSALVQATGRIAAEEDYSVRAPVAHDDEFGQLARSFNTMIEVIGRREVALKESEERMRRLASATFEGIVFSEGGRILEVNEQAARMWGFDASSVVGRSTLDFVAPESREFCASILANSYTGTFEATGQRQDGARFHFEARVQECSYQGRAARVVALRDVSARKQAEADRNALEEQLRQSQKMEAVGRLAGGVAHDFNNMLTVILGHTELALDRPDLSSGLRATLTQVQRAGQHSADLTRQLLTFARRQTVTPKILDLNRTISGMLTMLQRLIGEDIRIAWMPGPQLGSVRIDPTQMDQILANLCVNSRDAIAGIGQITIETRHASFDEAYCAKHVEYLPGSFLRLSVTDNGHGIAAETLPYIFEPFFTTKDVGEGTGLGLATVFGIVKQNDGFIIVESSPGVGTTFHVYFPEVQVAASEERPFHGSHPPRSQGETVLLVDDEPAVLGLGQEILKTLGYAVLTARTPGEALQLAQSRRIDLLVTDVIMPDMTGRHLADSIADLQPGIRCLFVSGYSATVISDRGVLADGVRFLQKPFSVHTFASSVRDALVHSR